MIISTTPTLEGYKITQYRGVIATEAILGENPIKDITKTNRRGTRPC